MKTVEPATRRSFTSAEAHAIATELEIDFEALGDYYTRLAVLERDAAAQLTRPG